MTAIYLPVWLFLKITQKVKNKFNEISENYDNAAVIVRLPALLFSSGVLGAPWQRQAGPELIAATCSLSSAAAHSLITAPALKVSPCCWPLPGLQCFAAGNGPVAQRDPEVSLPHHLCQTFPGPCLGISLFLPPSGIWPQTILALPLGLQIASILSSDLLALTPFVPSLTLCW